MVRRCRGANIHRSKGAEVQRSSVAGLQKPRLRGSLAQGCRYRVVNSGSDEEVKK